jgi:hypothetical protein
MYQLPSTYQWMRRSIVVVTPARSNWMGGIPIDSTVLAVYDGL